MFRLFRKSDQEVAADRLYRSIVAQARLTPFYESWGVEDTVEGRFELISIHAFLLLHRLKSDRAVTALLSQAFVDLMFADLDRNLREMGVGDMGIGKRVKLMASAFYGRVAAYDRGIFGDDDILGSAVLRNVFGGKDSGAGGAAHLATYMRCQARQLASAELSEVLLGPSWAPLPDVELD
jgi:cytochrome b pre-mRNA-processing protein 3